MKKQNKIHYRQGDVLIERVDSFPANLTKVARDGDRVILAYGEVTGHAHFFGDAGTEKFVDEKGAEFFRVRGPKIDGDFPLVRHWRDQVMIRHLEHGIVEFHRADVEVDGSTVRVTGEFGLLKHDEHHTEGVPAGLYRGGAADGKVRQREYSPEAIRNVAD